MAYRAPDFNFPEDFYLDDVGVWRLKKEKLAELENPRPQTKEAWLRSCSTEQLAELFVGVARDGADALKRCNGSFEPLNIYKHEFWVEWLKQPYSPK